jgi:hypothetical protein
VSLIFAQFKRLLECCTHRNRPTIYIHTCAYKYEQLKSESESESDSESESESESLICHQHKRELGDCERTLLGHTGPDSIHTHTHIYIHTRAGWETVNEPCLDTPEQTHYKHTHTHIYIYIHARVGRL